MILTMAKVGRKPNEDRRNEVRAMLASGESQSSVARSLGVSQPYIAKLAREFGIAARSYGAVVEQDGKRLCRVCGKSKTAGAFSSKTRVCRVCYGQSGS
jgi:hypothetical protein